MRLRKLVKSPLQRPLMCMKGMRRPLISPLGKEIGPRLFRGPCVFDMSAGAGVRSDRISRPTVRGKRFRNKGRLVGDSNEGVAA